MQSKQTIWDWLWMTIEILCYYFISYLGNKKKKSLPDLDLRTGILSRKASELVQDIKTNKVKCLEVVTAAIDRINTVNPILNAVTDERYVLAIKEAQLVDEAVNKADEKMLNKPLLGIPFTVQESMGVQHLYCTMGLLSRKHLKASEDGVCVKILKNAGAILIAVSNVPEIDIWSETRNKVFGQTCNPHHTGKSVGGSGGGEAALVTSLCSHIGLCRDVTGSSLMAASYCGVFAHCPTPGMVALNGVCPSNNKMLNPAIIARNFDDLLMTTSVLSSYKQNKSLQFDDVKLFYTDIPGFDSKLMNRYLNKILSTIKSETGKSVNGLKLNKFDNMPFIYRCWLATQMNETSKLLANRKGKVNGTLELIKKILGLSRHTLGPILSLINYPELSEHDVAAGESVLTDIKEEICTTLGDNGVLLYPISIKSAPYHFMSFLKQPEQSFWSLASLIQCPAIQVPLGTDDEGMPVGLQIIASPYNDEVCFEVAKYFAKIFGGHVLPCQIK